MTEALLDSVLIARGKYSTLNGQRRAKLEKLRRNMEAVAGYASRILRAVDDAEFAKEQMTAAQEHMTQGAIALLECNELKKQLDELRPEAWGNEKDRE